jgi:hypothetical protein
MMDSASFLSANKLSRNDDACSPSLRACEAIQKITTKSIPN